ncbi:MAG: glycosyltransferase family 39 protein [Solirubrobacteraceae bacterium]
MAVVAGPHQGAAPATDPSSPPAGTAPWLLAAIVVLGALLRFTTLNEQSLWFDEATTWGIVHHGLGHVLATVPRTESTPPLYYVLLWLWSRVFGTGAVGLRSFSALCGTLTIPIMWAIGRRLVSERVGLVAALLTAVNPLLFWYAQEARSYSLLLLLSAVSLLALVRALQAPSVPRVLWWSIACALALASHYYAAVAIVSEAAWLGACLHRRGLLTGRRAIAGLAPVVAVGAALTPLMLEQNDGRASFISTAEGSLPYRLGQLAKQDLIGEGQPHRALLTALAGALALVALALLLRRAKRRERSAALMALVVGAGGVVVALLVSVAVSDYFNTRNLLPTWPALALLAAIGLGAGRAGRTGTLATAALAVLSLFCVWNIVSDSGFQRPNWRGAAQVLGARSGPRAIVSDSHSQVTLDPYMRGLKPYPATGTRVREVDLVWLQRHGPWGAIEPLTPVALPGFPRMSVVRTKSYVVVRYRAAAPQPEPAAALDRLYPLPASELSLLQRG